MNTKEEENISIEKISEAINELASDGSDFYIEIKSDTLEQSGLVFKNLYLFNGEWVFIGIDHLIMPISFKIKENAIIHTLVSGGGHIYDIITKNEQIKIYMN